MTEPIVIVGMACEYPGARSPLELWENALAQRQAFRPLPPERLSIDDYPPDDPRLGLGAYTGQAAVLEGYAFDRQRFRIAGSTHRTVDPAHWLALDCADRALRDAGFADGAGLPASTTGVLIGNTLTGDHSRAAALQLRWPYVARRVVEGLDASGIGGEERLSLLARIRTAFLGTLPDVNEETLAGWLSNTIAGRICNYFDLKGGGYVVDGACASSLLAVTNACTALAVGDLDVAIAGGVDLSLDPFELVGFARAGALAAADMRVFDRQATGFWPGEGCGIVVLMRESDARAQGRTGYARILGWGTSSDGRGGITRPEPDGQAIALDRAYRRAGVSIAAVSYFEAHGTGTAAGDEVELAVIARALRDAGAAARGAAIGSLKANVGHTKAAAGVAGLLKATLAVHTRIVPPVTACREPKLMLHGDGPLRVLSAPQAWPDDRPCRAGVSAMGFGGINAHVVIEGLPREPRIALGVPTHVFATTAQDVELIPLAADSRESLAARASALREWLAQASRAELTDLAIQCQRDEPHGRVRAALVAPTPHAMAARAGVLLEWLATADRCRIGADEGVFLAEEATGTIGLLFPGQGVPLHEPHGAWERRFDPEIDGRSGSAQVSIVRASLASLGALRQCGLDASVAIGLSLGELTALHWAGALEKEALLDLVAARAEAMDRDAHPGTMAALGTDVETARRLLDPSSSVVVSCVNGPGQTVVSGTSPDIEAMMRVARRAGISASRLPVPHAFHSPLMAPAAARFARALDACRFVAPTRRVVSTVLGRRITAGDRIEALLTAQLTSPVLLLDAMHASRDVDLWIEVGPGRTLSHVIAQQFGQTVIAIDTGRDSFRGWLTALAAAYASGAAVRWSGAAERRFSRPIDLSCARRFLVSPCEADRQGHSRSAALRDDADSWLSPRPIAPPASPTTTATRDGSSERPVDVARRLIAAHTELPFDGITPSQRLLSDLHLNSVSIAMLASDLARALGREWRGRMDLGDMSVDELAAAVASSEPPMAAADMPASVGPWTRPFVMDLQPCDPIGREVVRQPRTATVIGAAESPVSSHASQALARAGGGVLVCLPRSPDGAALLPLLRAVRQVVTDSTPTLFVVLVDDSGGRALARTLHLEAPQHDVLLVHVTPDHPDPESALLQEMQTVRGFREVHLGSCGRFTPAWMPLDAPSAAMFAIGPGDVMLVTGGASGITAECALAMARATGAALALVGRSAETSESVCAMLERCRTSGVRARYAVADLRDRAKTAAAIAALTDALGAITGVLHGAAINDPCLLADLGDDLFLRTVETKLVGATHVLEHVDPSRLRWFVAFGSVIGQTGLRGEAHYGSANELLAAWTRRLADALPACRCVTIEWSVWSGAGMGERLARVAALQRQGIAPITLDQGIALFLRLLRTSGTPSEIVASGRLGAGSPLRMEAAALPLRRFLERPRVHVPRVELIADADLSTHADPYVTDHRVGGRPVVPAVMLLEAMVSAAEPLLSQPPTPVFELRHVRFRRPIALGADDTATRLQIAGLRQEDGSVDLVVRSSDTSFTEEHAGATCVPADAEAWRASARPADIRQPPLIDAEPFYEALLFQRGRFRRVRHYRRLHARWAVAEVDAIDDATWFGGYLPQPFVLGDPGARDAAIHAVQACVPDQRLLPIGVDRLWIDASASPGRRLIEAVEREQEDALFVYDVTVRDAAGRVRERWDGLRFWRVERVEPVGGWPVAAIAPLLERLLPPHAGVRMLAAPCVDRPGHGRSLIERLTGSTIHGRGDGRPEAPDRSVSASHAGGIGLAVEAAVPVACDIEQVISRPPDAWRSLLSRDDESLAGAIAADEPSGDVAVASTRVWAARECLRKLGLPSDAPLMKAERRATCLALHGHGVTVTTTMLPIAGASGRPFAVALALEERDACAPAAACMLTDVSARE